MSAPATPNPYIPAGRDAVKLVVVPADDRVLILNVDGVVIHEIPYTQGKYRAKQDAEQFLDGYAVGAMSMMKTFIDNPVGVFTAVTQAMKSANDSQSKLRDPEERLQ